MRNTRIERYAWRSATNQRDQMLRNKFVIVYAESSITPRIMVTVGVKVCISSTIVITVWHKNSLKMSVCIF